MQSSQLIQKSQNLAPIQSTAFDIYITNQKGIDYFAYFPKEEYKQSPQLDNFLKLDLGINHDIKYLRKYCPQISNQWYAFERPAESQILSSLTKLEETVIIKIISDLINSLFNLHQRGLLGRCFNVNNILFVQQSYAVMMEFGFYPKLEYKVPEILYGYNENNYNEKIDIFLLGRVLYFLMVGKDIPVFSTNNYANISNEIQVSIATTKYSEALKKIAVSMLNWDAGKRIDFLQLISKFKNPQTPQQEQFYRQPLSNSIIKFIEQREVKFQIDNNDMDSFLVQNTCFIEKIQKEQLQGTQQKLVSNIQKGPSLSGSQQLKQNSSSDCDFLPPDIGTRQLDQQHIISNVGETKTTTITQSQQVQEQKLRSTLVQNDIYLSILPYLNADRPNDMVIWNRLYFTQYRFSLLKKLTDQLTQYEKTIKQYMIPICIFALRKAQIILKKEFYSSLEINSNIYEIEKKDWDSFVSRSVEYQRMKQKVKQELDIIVPQFSQNHYPQVKKVIDVFYQDQLMNELLQHTGQYLDDNLNAKNFEDIKKSYRYVLTNTLTLFDNIKDRQACQTKLLILMCILINRICDISAIGQHFKTIQTFLKINEVSSIVEIELFFNRAAESDYLNQFDELKSVYFSG